MSLHFGTDGVRGLALSELTEAFAGRLGLAAAEVLGAGSWLIARDTRESGEVLGRALAAGLAHAGAEPVDLGVLPTPALAWLSAERGLPAAMVTASHNPWQDNGVKIFASGGVKLSDSLEARIERVLHDGRPDVAMSVAPLVRDALALDSYVAHLVLSNRRLDGLHVVLDLANGAMHVAAPAVLRALGATVEVLHATPDGHNINDACGATDTRSLQDAVVARRADIGLAFDGDGDRVIAVDHKGRVVDGDRMLALAALHLREHGLLRGDTVVVTVMSNLGFHRAMEAAGVRVVTSAVGDRAVLEALDAGDWSLGGEQSGHIIYRDLSVTGDGLLAGLHLAAFVLDHRAALADLAASVMTSFPQVLVNVRVAGRHPDAAAELAEEIAAAEAVLGDHGRVLVRSSGTEPLVRVMVEAPTDELAGAVAAELAARVGARFGTSPTG